MPRIPQGITRDDVINAIRDLDRGVEHLFGRSRRYDLVYGGRRYAPKAVLGLAARRLAGRALTPADFTGGSESQCHAILEGLRFEIATKTAGAETSNRTSPEAARRLIEALLDDVPVSTQRIALRFLAESIHEAAQSDNDRWAVTLDPNRVRFNVGQTESVVLWASSVNVLVKSNARIAGTTLREGSYPSAGGSRLRNVPYDVAGAVLPLLELSHVEAKELARRHPCTRVIKDAHSPGVVAFLWRELSMPGMPPVPTHYLQARPPLGRRERQAALEADERVAELPDLDETERHAVIKQRLAQRLFRYRLGATRCRCPITGIEDPAHLRASHIKPWKDCNDRERQDPDNGLLLAPHVDHLFDRGYLTFEDDGRVLIARNLDRAVLAAWGLDRIKRVDPFPPGQRRYLRYHRTSVFRRSRRERVFDARSETGPRTDARGRNQRPAR